MNSKFENVIKVRGVNWKGCPEEIDFARTDYESPDENYQARIFLAASTMSHVASETKLSPERWYFTLGEMGKILFWLTTPGP